MFDIFKTDLGLIYVIFEHVNLLLCLVLYYDYGKSVPGS